MTKQLSFLDRAEPKPAQKDDLALLADDITDEVIRVRVARRAGKKASFQRAKIARAHEIEKRTAEWKALRWAIGAGMRASFREIGRAVWTSLSGTVEVSTACYCCGAEQTMIKPVGKYGRPTGMQIGVYPACEGIRLRKVGGAWLFVCPEHGTIEPLDVAAVTWSAWAVKSAAGDNVGVAEFVYVDKKESSDV